MLRSAASCCLVATLLTAAGVSERLVGAAPTGTVAILLSEGRISLVDVGTGQQLAAFAASDQPPYTLSVGRLAQTTGGDEVFAVLPDQQGPVVAALSMRTFVGRQVGRLPSDTYPALDVGRRTGRLFAFGSAGATVVVLDPGSGEQRTVLSIANGRDAYTGAVSRDERRIYVSYHGRGTGIDWFDETNQGWRPRGYLRSHGGFVLVENTLLATAGEHLILEVDTTGRTLRTLNTGLYGNHLMEFAVDTTRRMIYAVGPCAYAGGFSSTPWRVSGETAAQLLVPVRDYSVCGDRISVSSQGTWLAVAWLPSTIPVASRAGAVLVIDTKTGEVLRRIATPSEPVDVLAVR